MNSHQRDLLKRLLPLCVVVVIPGMLLLPYWMPIHGIYLEIGNDFVCLYYTYKAYFLNSLCGGHFPLWSPNEGAGYCFWSNPFTQAFYPLNVILYGMNAWLGGYTILDHQRFTVVAVCGLTLGMYALLRQTGRSVRSSIFGAIVSGCSYKVTELLRFPNALHAAACYPWVMIGILKIIQAGSWKQVIKAGSILTVSLIFLGTAGYPYFVYYGFFLFIPFLLLCLDSEVRCELLAVHAVRWRMIVVVLSLSGIVAGTILAPFYRGIAALMRQTCDRMGGDWVYSTKNSFSIYQSIGSLIFPPIASCEGWYYFGATVLFLIILCIAAVGLGWLSNVKSSLLVGIPDTSNIIGKKVLLRFLLWGLLVANVTYGDDSLLFRALWHVMPGFSGLREWGRLNIILVPMIGIVLAVSYDNFETILKNISIRSTSLLKRRILGGMLLTAIVILVSQGTLLLMAYRNHQWIRYCVPNLCNNIYSMESMFPNRLKGANVWVIDQMASVLVYTYPVMVCFAVVVLMLVVVKSSRSRFSSAHGWETLVLLTSLSLVDIGLVGPWIWSRGFSPLPVRSPLCIVPNQSALAEKRIDCYGTIPLNGSGSVGVVENWYYDRYIKFRKAALSEPDAVQKILGITTGRRLFFSANANYSKVSAFLAATLPSDNWYSVAKYNGDALVIDVNVPCGGYIHFIDNWAPGWVGEVDGIDVQVESLFGTFKSIKVSEGAHHVEFSFKPFFHGDRGT